MNRVILRQYPWAVVYKTCLMAGIQISSLFNIRRQLLLVPVSGVAGFNVAVVKVFRGQINFVLLFIATFENCTQT